MKVKCLLIFAIFCFFLNFIGPPAFAETVYRGLFVGITNYENGYDNLKFSAKDAEAMHQTLITSPYQNYPFVNTILLTSIVYKQDVMDAIQDIWNDQQANDPEGDDVFFFFWSGHGDLFAETFPPYDEADGKDEALITTDSHILDDELSNWLEPFPYVVMMIDTCFSGGMIKSLDGIIKDGDGLANDIMRAATHKKSSGGKDLDDNKGRVVVTACDDHELSREEVGFAHGVFTFFLLKGLNNSFAEADLDDNQILSAEEEGWFVTPLVSGWTQGEQNPQLYDSDGCVELPFACRSLIGCNCNRHDKSHFAADQRFLDDFKLQMPALSSKQVAFVFDCNSTTWQNLTPDKINVTPSENNTAIVETLKEITLQDPAGLKVTGACTDTCQQSLKIYTGYVCNIYFDDQTPMTLYTTDSDCQPIQAERLFHVFYCDGVVEANSSLGSAENEYFKLTVEMTGADTGKLIVAAKDQALENIAGVGVECSSSPYPECYDGFHLKILDNCSGCNIDLNPNNLILQDRDDLEQGCSKTGESVVTLTECSGVSVTTSNENVATAIYNSGNGKLTVTAAAAGSAAITVTCVDDLNCKTTLNVTVEECPQAECEITLDPEELTLQDMDDLEHNCSKTGTSQVTLTNCSTVSCYSEDSSVVFAYIDQNNVLHATAVSVGSTKIKLNCEDADCTAEFPVTVVHCIENDPPKAPTLILPENGSIIDSGMITFKWINNGDPDGDQVGSWLFAIGPWEQKISLDMGSAGSIVGEEISIVLPIFTLGDWVWTVYIWDPAFNSDPYYNCQEPFWVFTTNSKY